MSGRKSKKNLRLGSSRRPKGLNRNIEKDDNDGFQQIAESEDGQDEFHTTSATQFDHPPSSSIEPQTSELECPSHARGHKDSLMETELPERKRKMGSTRKSTGRFKGDNNLDDVRTAVELDKEYKTQPKTSTTEKRHVSLTEQEQSSFPSDVSLQNKNSGFGKEPGTTPIFAVSEKKEITSLHREVLSDLLIDEAVGPSVHSIACTVTEQDSVMFNDSKTIGHQETQIASTTGQKKRMGSTRRPIGEQNSENVGVQEHSRNMTENERKAEVMGEAKMKMSEVMAQTWDDVARDDPSSHTESALLFTQSLLANRAELKEPGVVAGTETMNQSVAFPLVDSEKPLPETSSHHGTPLLNEALDFEFASHPEDLDVLNKVLEEAGSHDSQYVCDARKDTNPSYDFTEVKKGVLMQKEKPQLENFALHDQESSLIQHDIATLDNSHDCFMVQTIVGGSRSFDMPVSNISHAEPTTPNLPHDMRKAIEERQEIHIEMKQENNVCNVSSVTCDILTDLVSVTEEDKDPHIFAMRENKNMSNERGSEKEYAFKIKDQWDVRHHNVTQITLDVGDNEKDVETSTEITWVSHQKSCDVSTEKEELYKGQEHYSLNISLTHSPTQDGAGKMLENEEVRKEQKETENTGVYDVTSNSDSGSHAHQQLFMQFPDKEGYDLHEMQGDKGEKEGIFLSVESENAAFERTDRNKEMGAALVPTLDVEDADLHLQIEAQNKTLDTTNSKANGTEENITGTSVLVRENRITKNTVESNMTEADFPQSSLDAHMEALKESENSEKKVSGGINLNQTDINIVPQDSHREETHSKSSPVVQKRKMGSTRRPLKGNKGQRKETELYETLDSEVLINVQNKSFRLESKHSPDESTFTSLKDGAKQQMEKNYVGPFEVPGSALLQSSGILDLVSEESTAISICHITESQTLTNVHIESQENAERVAAEEDKYLQLENEAQNKISDSTTSEVEETEKNRHDATVSVREVKVIEDTDTAESNMNNESDFLQISPDAHVEALNVSENSDKDVSGETDTNLKQSDISIIPADSQKEETHSKSSPVIQKRKMGSTRRPLKGNTGQRKGHDEKEIFSLEDEPSPEESRYTAVSICDISESQTLKISHVGSQENFGDVETVPAEGDTESHSEDKTFDSTAFEKEEAEELVIGDAVTVISNMTTESDLHQSSDANMETLKVSENPEDISETYRNPQSEVQQEIKMTELSSEAERTKDIICEGSVSVREDEFTVDTVTLDSNMTTDSDTLNDAKLEALNLSKNSVSAVMDSVLLGQDDVTEGSREIDTLPEQSHICVIPDDSHGEEAHSVSSLTVHKRKMGSTRRPLKGNKGQRQETKHHDENESLNSEDMINAISICHITESQTFTDIHVEPKENTGDAERVAAEDDKDLQLEIEARNKTYDSTTSEAEETENNRHDATVLVREVEVIEDTDTVESNMTHEFLQSSPDAHMEALNVSENSKETNIHSGSQENIGDVEIVPAQGDTESHSEDKTFNTTAFEEEAEVREVLVIGDAVKVVSNMTTESDLLQTSNANMEPLKVFENAEKNISGETDTILKQSDISIIPADSHREDTHSKSSPVIQKRKMGSTRRPLKGNRGQIKETEHHDENQTLDSEEMNNAIHFCHITESQTLTNTDVKPRENTGDAERVAAKDGKYLLLEIEARNKTSDSTTSEAEETEKNRHDAPVLVREVEVIGDTDILESNMTNKSDLLQSDTLNDRKMEALILSENTESVSAVTDSVILGQDYVTEGSREIDTLSEQSHISFIPDDSHGEEAHSVSSLTVHKRKMGSTRRPLKGNKGQRKETKHHDENETLDSEDMINAEKQTLGLENESGPGESTLQSIKDGAKEQEKEICEKNDVESVEESESALLQSSSISDLVSEESTAISIYHITESQSLTHIQEISQDNTGDAERVAAEEDKDLQLETDAQNKTSDSTTSEAEETEKNRHDATVLVKEVQVIEDTDTVESNMTHVSDFLQNSLNAHVEALKISKNAAKEVSGETDTVAEQSDTSIIPADSHREETHSKSSPVIQKRKMGSTRRPLKGNKGQRKETEHHDKNETLDSEEMINAEKQTLGLENESGPGESTLQSIKDGPKEQEMEICEKNDVESVEESESALLQSSNISDLVSEESTAISICHITESQTLTHIQEMSQDNTGEAERMAAEDGKDLQLEIDAQNKTSDSTTSEAEETEKNRHDATVSVREVEVIEDTDTVESNMTHESDFLQSSPDAHVEALNVSENSEKDHSEETDTNLKQRDISINPADSHREDTHSKSSPVIQKRKIGSTRRPLQGNTGRRKGYDEKEIFNLEDEPSPEESRYTAVSICDISESQTLKKSHFGSQENFGDVETVPAEGDTESHPEDKTFDATAFEEEAEVREVLVIGDAVKVVSNMTTESDLHQTSDAIMETLKVSENAEKNISGETDTVAEQSDISIIPADSNREETHSKSSPVIQKRKMGSTRRPLKVNKGQRKETEHHDENETLDSKDMIDAEKQTLGLENESCPGESTLQSIKDGAKEQEMEICEKNDVEPVEESESALLQSSSISDLVSEESTAISICHITESQSLTNIQEMSQDNTGDAERVAAEDGKDLQLETDAQNKTSDSTSSEADETEKNRHDGTVSVREVEVIEDTDTVESNMTHESDFLQSSPDAHVEALNVSENSEKKVSGETDTNLKQSDISIIPADSQREETHSKSSPVIQKRKMGSTRRPLKGKKGQRKETERHDKNDTLDSEDMISAISICHITESQTLTNINVEPQENTGDAERVAGEDDKDLLLETDTLNKTSDSTTSEAEETETNIQDINVTLIREAEIIGDTVTVVNNRTIESDFIQRSPDAHMKALKISKNAAKEVSGETDTVAEQSDTSIIPADSHREETHSKSSPVIQKRKMGSTRRPLKGNKGQRKETEHHDKNETLDSEEMINAEKQTLGLENESGPGESTLQSIKDEAKEQEMEICEKNDVEPVEESESALLQSSSIPDLVSEESTEISICHITESQTLTNTDVKPQENTGDAERMVAEEDKDLLLESEAQNKTSDSTTSETEATETNIQDVNVTLIRKAEVIGDTVTIASNITTESGFIITSPDAHMEALNSEHMISAEKQTFSLEGEPSPEKSKLQSSRDGTKEQEMEICEKNDVEPVEESESALLQSSSLSDLVSEESTAISICHIPESQTLTHIQEMSQENTGNAERVAAEEDKDLQLETDAQNKTSDSTSSEAEETEKNRHDATVLVKEVEVIEDTDTVESNMTHESDFLQSSPDAHVEALNVSENSEKKVSGETDTNLKQSDISIIPADSQREETHSKSSPVIQKRKIGSTRRPLKGNKGQRNEKEHCGENDTLDSEDMISAISIYHNTESQTLTNINVQPQENTGDVERVVAEDDKDLLLETDALNKTSDSTTSIVEETEKNIQDINVTLIREAEIIGDTVTVVNNMTIESDFIQSSLDAHMEALKVSKNAEKEVSGETDTNLNQSDINIVPADSHREETHSKSSPVVHKRKMGSTRRPLKGNTGQRNGHDMKEIFNFEDEPTPEESRYTAVSISDISESQTLITIHSGSHENIGDVETVPAEGDTESHSEDKTFGEEAEVREVFVIGDAVTVVSNMTTESDLLQTSNANMEPLKVFQNAEKEVSKETDTILKQSDISIIPADSQREETHSKSSPVIQKRKMGSTRRPLKGNKGQRKETEHDENKTLDSEDMINAISICHITESQTLTNINVEPQENTGDAERVAAEGDKDLQLEIDAQNKTYDSTTSEAEKSEKNRHDAPVSVREVEVMEDTDTVESNMTHQFLQSSPDAHVEALNVSENSEKDVSGETDTNHKKSDISIIPADSQREEKHSKSSPVIQKRKMGSTRRPLKGVEGQRKEKEIFSLDDEPVPEESRYTTVNICDISESQTFTNIHAGSHENIGDVKIVPAEGDTESHSEDKTFDSTAFEKEATEENICAATALDRKAFVGDAVESNMTTESDLIESYTLTDSKPEAFISEIAKDKITERTDTISKQSVSNIIPKDPSGDEEHTKLSLNVHKRKMGSTRRPLRGNKEQRKVRVESKEKNEDSEGVPEEDTETPSVIQNQDNLVDHNVTHEILNISDVKDKERNTMKTVDMSVQKQFDDLELDQKLDASQTQTGLSQEDTGSHLLEFPESSADSNSLSDVHVSDALLVEETQIYVSSNDVPPTEEVERNPVSKMSVQKRKMGSTRKRGKRMVNSNEVEDENAVANETTITDDETSKSEEKLRPEEAITGSAVHQQLFSPSDDNEGHAIQEIICKSDVQAENSEQNDPNSTTTLQKLLIESQCSSNAAAEMVSDLPLGDVNTYFDPKQSVIPKESHREDQPNLNPVVQKRKMGSTRKTLRGNKGQGRIGESKKMDENSEGMTQEQDAEPHLETKARTKLDEEVEENFPVEFSHPVASLNLFLEPVKEFSQNYLSEVSEEKGIDITEIDSNNLSEAINEGTKDTFVLTVSHKVIHQIVSEPEQTEITHKVIATQEKRRKMGSTRRNPRAMHGRNMADNEDLLGLEEDRETDKADNDLKEASSITQYEEVSSVSPTDPESEMLIGATDLKGENDPLHSSRPTEPETPENTLQICDNQLGNADVTKHPQSETVNTEKRRKMGSTRKNAREGGIRGKREGYEYTETKDTNLQMLQDSEISLVGEDVRKPTTHDSSNQSEDSLLSEIERALLNKTSQSPLSCDWELITKEPNTLDLSIPENSEIRSLQTIPSTHSEPNSPGGRRRKMGSTRKNPRQQLKAERQDEEKEYGEIDENSKANMQEKKDLERVEVSVLHNITENKLNKDYLDVSSAHTSSNQLEESTNPVSQEKTSPSTKRKFGSRRANKDRQGFGRMADSDIGNESEDGYQKPDSSEVKDKLHSNDLAVCDPCLSLQPENQPASEQRNMEAKNEKATSKGTGAGLVSLDQIIKHDRSTGARQTVNLKNRISDTEVVQFNVVMVGNSYVGKTSFIRRFYEGQFTEDYHSTIGVDTCVQTVALAGKTVKLQIWDTAGQERFHSITTQVFHKADGLLLMYEIPCSKSFISVRDWISQARERAPDDVVMMLLGNKSDSEKREVQNQEGADLAREYNIHFMECSAATGANVSESMMSLAEMLVQRKSQKEKHTTLRRDPPQKKSGCC